MGSLNNIVKNNRKSNPMADNYHVGIRTIDDVKTFGEAMKNDESFYWGDFSRSDAEKSMKEKFL